MSYNESELDFSFMRFWIRSGKEKKCRKSQLKLSEVGITGREMMNFFV